MKRNMNLLETEQTGEKSAKLTMEIIGQSALTAEQLGAIEKLFINWFADTESMNDIKNMIKQLEF